MRFEFFSLFLSRVILETDPSIITHRIAVKVITCAVFPCSPATLHDHTHNCVVRGHAVLASGWQLHGTVYVLLVMCSSHLQADDGEQSVKQVNLLYICPTGHLFIIPFLTPAGVPVS